MSSPLARRAAALLAAAVMAGWLLPAAPARALLVSHVECWIMGGSVDTGDGPIPVEPDMYCIEVWEDAGGGMGDDAAGSDGGGAGGGYGGGSGAGSGGGTSSACAALAATKPDDCPDPVPIPSGASYGQDLYPNGSALNRLIGLINGGRVLPLTKTKLANALSAHTRDMAKLTIPMSEINARLLASVQGACEWQADHALFGAYGTRFCGEAYGRLQQEAGLPGYLDWLADWLELNDIDLGYPVDLLKAFIGLVSPENSLKIKYEQVAKDVECGNWWKQVEENGCGA